jgi:hypothetical protein
MAAALPLATLSLLTAAPGAQASTVQPTCDPGVPLVDFTTFDSNRTRVAYTQLATEFDLCVEVAGAVDAAVVINGGVTFSPILFYKVEQGECASTVINMTAPVRFSLSVDPQGQTICFTNGSSRTTITLNAVNLGQLTDVDVWLNGTQVA